MGSTIEQTVKALVEFEAQLDAAKSELQEAGRRNMKDAAGWSDAAKAQAISRAQQVASGIVSRAREEAEAEAEEIRRKGESALKGFEGSISKNRGRASQFVASRLLGETK